MVNLLVKHLKKSQQSVLERVKKYLFNLSSQDQNKILEVAKTKPDLIVKFSPRSKDQPRKIIKFLGEKEKKVKPAKKVLKPKIKKASVKKVAAPKVKQEDLSWIIPKLQNSDPYF